MKQAHPYLKWFFILLSLGSAVAILQSDFIQILLVRAEGFERVISVIAGMMFTSVFTTAPGIAILSELMQELPVWQVAILGGFGAVFGDFIIFHIIERTVHNEAQILLDLPQMKRFKKIFDTKLFHRFLWFLGALILASPLPDEIGLSLMGVSEIKTWQFLLTSFVFNTIGIALLASVVSHAML